MNLGLGLSLTASRAGTSGAADTTPPTADSVAFGSQQSSGNLPLTITALSENSTIGIVFTSSDQSAASAAAIRTAAEGGAALTDQLSVDTQAATVGGGPYTITDGVPTGRNGATFYQIAIWDAAGNTQTTTYTGSVSIDTTAPTVSSVATNSAGDEITITFTETMADASVNAGDWSVNDVTGGSATVGTPVVSTNTITLPLSGNTVQSGDSPTLDYSGGSVTDAFSNPLADFTDQAVTNNVPSGTVGVFGTAPFQAADASTAITPANVASMQADDVVFYCHIRANGPQSTDNAPSGTTLASDIESAGGGDSVGLAVYWERLSGAGPFTLRTVSAGSPNNGAHAVGVIVYRGLKTTGNPWNDLQPRVVNTTDASQNGLADITVANTSDLGVSFAGWGDDCTDGTLSYNNSSDFTTDTVREQVASALGGQFSGSISTSEGLSTTGAKDMGIIDGTFSTNPERLSVSMSLELA